MRKDTPKIQFRSDTLIALLVLAFLLLYTYGLLFVAPYPGFYFNPTDGRVSEIHVPQGSPPQLMLGDVIERVGQISFDEFLQRRETHFFQGLQGGQSFEMVVSRNAEPVTIVWTYPGFNPTEFLARFFNVWWLAYVFWFIGMSAKLHLRPQDTQWRLFVAANYLIAMFIVLGSLSSYRVMMSSILMRVVAWLILPAYLHFHWIFPQSFRRMPRWLKIIFYVAAGGLALGELFQLVPASSYFLAVVMAFGGSILLLVLHFIFQPLHRREVRLLAIAAVLALLPIILIGVIGSLGPVPHIGPLALLVLPILPGAYFYILSRRNLGGLELRTNRVISVYIFLVLLGTVLLLSIVFLTVTGLSRDAIIFGGAMVCLTTTFLGIQYFPAFQALIERRLLGIRLPVENMAEKYSSRIVTSNTAQGLVKLLEEEIFPSLLIRQYAFVETVNASAKITLARDVDQARIPKDALMDLIGSAPTGQPIPLSMNESPFGWVRLMLPLRVGSDLIGAWLLGRRDPDDHYPQAELPILESLANQTAVALSNITQTDRLKVMYDANIHRYEQERLRLARDLHDSLLNEMAAMLMKRDADSLPQDFQESFSGLIIRLREIVTDLRPPMLLYGLKYALEGLADNLSERNHDEVKILAEVVVMDDCRHPENVEYNIYRIVQEACENALRYAQARLIKISGELSLDQIDIQIDDDGIGLNAEISRRLDDMVANKHYGLAGMHERAALIGATIRIQSETNHGTHISIRWKSMQQ